MNSMKKNAATWLLMLLPLIALANNSDGSIFHKGDFETIKQQALQEGKLIFVDFYADYCYACKLMDETTFVDERLKDYLKDKYIPYKVDILVDFDGISLKQEYNITVLPTILVFNSSGELVGRYETMLGPSRMINELSKYDVPKNRIQTGEPILAQKEQEKENPLTAAPIPVFPKDKPAEYNKVQPLADEVAPPTESKIRPFVDDNAIQSDESRINGHIMNSADEKEEEVVEENLGFVDLEAEKPKILPKSDTRLNVSPTATFASKKKEYQAPKELLAEGLFEFTVKPYPNNGYGVQIGVFAQYGNVLREVQKLQGKFSQPILVNISNFEGRVVYKVIVGSFETRREAISFRRMMRKKEADGVIKDLASVKLAN